MVLGFLAVTTITDTRWNITSIHPLLTIGPGQLQQLRVSLETRILFQYHGILSVHKFPLYIKIRWSHDNLIFIIWIHEPGKMVFVLKKRPVEQASFSTQIPSSLSWFLCYHSVVALVPLSCVAASWLQCAVFSACRPLTTQHCHQQPFTAPLLASSNEVLAASRGAAWFMTHQASFSMASLCTPDRSLLRTGV